MRSTDRALTPQAGVPLASFSTIGVGGPARWFVNARTVDDVAAAHDWCVAREQPLFVLGGGSNVIIADEGFDGLVLRLSLTGTTATRDTNDTLVRVAAGEPWDPFVARMVQQGLGGVECLSGIPGTVGGTPIQNVGAYGQEVADVIDTVTVFHRQERRVLPLPASACGFAYRTSRFKGADAGRFVVCEVTFRLRPRPAVQTYPDVQRELHAAGTHAPGLPDVREAVLRIRRRKGMVIDPADDDTRSVGSFFMNPVVTDACRERLGSLAGEPAPAFVAGTHVKVPAAWLIERAGFRRGHVEGSVGLSGKHPLAIVNRGGATARDVLRLAARIKRQVGEHFGVWLRPEPVFVGLATTPELAFLQGSESDVDTAD